MAAASWHSQRYDSGGSTRRRRQLGLVMPSSTVLRSARQTRLDGSQMRYRHSCNYQASIALYNKTSTCHRLFEVLVEAQVGVWLSTDRQPGHHDWLSLVTDKDIAIFS
ncbi:hypothetical protein PR202_gb28717 [Eleusine coracana subsp. coracana]|uniref:Uncharacterized protein n=1 Tax=Eleusine coracana subsp. coracana TaxID=191504 RepID=A0AAV5FY23_ELECO|nr:hypothetical protein PR202_gb28717 [Eleusine coracana subsp. coracana]